MRSQRVAPDQIASGGEGLLAGAVLLAPIRLGERTIPKGTRMAPALTRDISAAARGGTFTTTLRLGWAEPGDLHEDDAALALARAVAGPGILTGAPRQSRVDLTARTDGVLRVNVEALARINRVDPLEVFSLFHGQSVRAGQIVRRLRDFISRGETERRVENLDRLVGEASALALIGSREQGVDVDLKLDPTATLVLVDRIQIQQVLLNLMRNAIEAMEGSGARQLEISSHRQGDGWLRVTIADSGPGLAPEVAAKLFQPFVSTKAAGMGLGLSICHTIVRANEGRIWTEPSRFGGTAFHFTLINAERDGKA